MRFKTLSSTALTFVLFAALALDADGELAPEARQFDFWIGEWDVDLRIRQDDGSWPDSVRAEAKIYSVLQGKAFLELWNSPQTKGFSLRYFDVAKNKWVLWLLWPAPNKVGTSGLEGSFHHGRGEFFARREQPDGTTSISRYTFSDITADRLRWDDAYSKDGGATWSNRWIMEFSRTGKEASLDPKGGEAHTYHDGSRCDLEPFRRFEVLSGHRRGGIRQLDARGSWVDSKAELTGYKILDGCAVATILRYERAGVPVEIFQLLTWNTWAEKFEEVRLDSEPSSALEVYYGDASTTESGTAIGFQRSRQNSAEPGTRRNRWRITDVAIELDIETSTDGVAWQPAASLTFAR